MRSWDSGFESVELSDFNDNILSTYSPDEGHRVKSVKDIHLGLNKVFEGYLGTELPLNVSNTHTAVRRGKQLGQQPSREIPFEYCKMS